MKKIVGLVLASVMALGTTAFAGSNVDTKGKAAKKPVATRKMKQQTGQNMQQSDQTTPTKKVSKTKKHSTTKHRASRKSGKRHNRKTTKKTAAKTT